MNVILFGIVIGGEELHNNHHAYPTSAKLSHKLYELDAGWMYIRVMAAPRLATIRKVAQAKYLLEARGRSITLCCERYFSIVMRSWLPM
jgi:stearoyl-CoA desaturase (delta-9 desaturase)